jgi:hypothetical protein
MSLQPPPPPIGADPLGTPSPPPDHAPEPKQRRTWRVVGLVALALVVLGGVATMFLVLIGEAERDEQGTISEPGELTVLKLQVGDCFDDPGAPTGTETVEVSSVEAKPCSEPHDFEVFHTFDVEAEELPSQSELLDEAGQRCLEAFEPFVGTPYEESELDVNFMFPMPESWEAGDRTVVCSVVTMDGTKLVGTAEGSGS